MRFRVAGFVVVLAAVLARPAYADGYVNAGLGVSFGSPVAQGRADFAGAVGFLPREPIGVEIDVTYAPSFFTGAFTQNRLAAVMGNVIFAGRLRDRGRYGRRTNIRPYVSGGFGLMSEHFEAAGSSTSVTNEHLGVNVGAGIMALSREAIGIRADVRYFQDLVGSSSGSSSGIDFGSFHFFRASIGFVIAY